MRVGDTVHDNLIPLPFTAAGPTLLRLEGHRSLGIEGNALFVEVNGGPEYVEELPDSWRPKE